MKKFFFLIAVLLAAGVLGNAQNTSPYWSLAGNSNATSASKLGTTNNISVRFYTNNVQRMILTSSAGQLGIGTASPNSRLHVNSASGENPFRAQVNGATKFFVDDLGGVTVGSSTTPPTNGLYVNGNTGIGTATPSYKLHVVASGTAIYGNSTAGLYGVWGNSTYLGVYGTGNTYGVYGFSDASIGVRALSSTGYGLYGTSSGSYNANGSTGVYGSGYYGIHGVGTYGVWGESSDYLGVYGVGGNWGVYGYTAASNGYGVYGLAAGSGGRGVYGYGLNGVYGDCNVGGGNALYGNATAASAYGAYIYSSQAIGIYASTGNASSWAGYFGGRVYSSGGYTSSDKKLKQDITDVSNAMDLIKKLKPKYYHFRKDGNYKFMNLPEGKHYGLIAQDVEQVLPNLVADAEFNTSKLPDPEQKAPVAIKPGETIVAPASHPAATEKKSEIISFKTMNYTELIPILVKGMQEQQTQIEKLTANNEALQSEIDNLKSVISKTNNGTLLAFVKGYLKQNSPNPFNNNTVISYYVPDNAGYAQIKITDVKGSVIKTFNAAKGEGQIKIINSELPAGTYNYTLYINNKTVDTKQMVLVK